MRNTLTFVLLIAWTSVAVAPAQTQTAGPATGTATTGTTSSTLADRSPGENVRRSAIVERAPGQIVNQVRADHTARTQARLGAQRSGDTSSLLAPERAPGATAGNGTGGGGLTDLLSGALNSGLLGSLGGLLGGGANNNGANNNAAGGAAANSGTGAAAADTSANPNIPSNLTPEVIALLQASGININDVFPAQNATARSQQSLSTSTAASKTDARSQTADAQPSFRVRWADAMLSTLFTAVVVGLQTPDFVNTLVDLIRPIFFPNTPATTNTTTTAAGANNATPPPANAQTPQPAP